MFIIYDILCEKLLFLSIWGATGMICGQLTSSYSGYMVSFYVTIFSPLPSLEQKWMKK